MIVIDYNGTGIWSLDAVLRRYELYARRYGIASPRRLDPLVLEAEGRRWIYPVMDCVIKGIEEGDTACAEIGVDFIEESASFTFGRILKAKVARALRRAPLTAGQKERIRKRVVEMLCTGYLPREYRQYAKLARNIGLEDWSSRVEREADLNNVRVRRYYEYFKEHAAVESRV
jgi:hypothetical protein